MYMIYMIAIAVSLGPIGGVIMIAALGIINALQEQTAVQIVQADAILSLAEAQEEKNEQ